MSKRDSGTDLFSFKRATSSVSAPLPTQQYFPYENAWKEFDRLHKTAQGGDPLRVVVWIFEFSLSVVGIYGFHLTKGSNLVVFDSWGAAFVAAISELVKARTRRGVGGSGFGAGVGPSGEKGYFRANKPARAEPHLCGCGGSKEFNSALEILQWNERFNWCPQNRGGKD